MISVNIWNDLNIYNQDINYYNLIFNEPCLKTDVQALSNPRVGRFWTLNT